MLLTMLLPDAQFTLPLSAIATTSGCVDAAATCMEPSPSKTVWMLWDKGESDLTEKHRSDKYMHASQCLSFWRRLNPAYDVRVLNTSSASILSPAYRALQQRKLPSQLMADVSRLGLQLRSLSVYD